MLDRIRLLLAEQQLSSTQFADAIGVSRPVVSHIMSGRNKPSLEVVQRIVAAFPFISTNWLLTGVGSMRITGPEPAAPAEKRKGGTYAPSGAAEVPAPVPGPSMAPQTLAAPVSMPVVASPQPEPAQTVQSSPEILTKPAMGPPPVPASLVPPASASGTVAGSSSEVALAQALAEPGKRIRRIVIFYQDGTFSDYQPE